MALLLFDIDGTLINTDGCGRKAVDRCFQKYFNIDNALDNVPLMGRTDSFIWKQACKLHRIFAQQYQKVKAAFMRDFYKYLKENLNNSAHSGLCPGIKELLLKVNRKHALGLLTGNFKQSGYIKISHFHIDHFFPVGAFGDDHEDRNFLAYLAIRRARIYYKKKFNMEKVFIIGDTPYDIECAKAADAVSVAVATGYYSLTELRKHSPDHLFPSLKDLSLLLSLFD